MKGPGLHPRDWDPTVCALNHVPTLLVLNRSQLYRCDM